MSGAARLGLVAAVTLLVAGCASVGGADRAAATPRTLAQLGPVSTDVTWPAATWWSIFQDPALDRWIERALQGNPSLAAAQARLARAAATAEGVRAGTLPQAGLSVDVTRQRFTENGLYPPPYGGAVFTTPDGRVTGSLELDFFGRNAASLRAALSQQRAAEAEAQAARTALASGIARTWVQLARLLEVREVAATTRDRRQQLLGLVQSRVQAGLDTRVELRQAEGTVPEITQQIEALDEQIAVTRNALAALAGTGPQDAADAAPRLPQLAEPALPAAIPADLVGRRADLVAARWRVEAAAGSVAASRAAFHPNVDLVGFIGLGSFGLSRWLQAGSTEWGVGPALRLPIFDAGRLRAGLRGATADLDAAVAGYDGVLVDAVHEVADAVVAVRAIGRQADAQQQAQQAADAAYELAVLRYRGGLTTFLTVLTAENNVLAQRRGVAELRARAIDARVQLIRALGGGFDDAAPALASRS